MKEKHPAREQEKKNRKDQSQNKKITPQSVKKERIEVETKDHTPKCKTHNGKL
jgi:hypothetical protein